MGRLRIYCACGCGGEVKAENKYIVSGHSRKGRKNTKLHNERISKSLNGHVFSNETKEKIRNTLKGNVAWNKGLTKDTDERVAKYAKSISKHRRENPRDVWNKGLTKEKDIKRDEYLLDEFGWNIIRFTGKEINKNLNSCISVVREVIRTG
uniref:Nuclease associated modular domain-containing protein n=1 Tax=viral metagenome TaxID=1070528 RepID=A0A6M3IPE7_9ZZZZ